MKGVTVFLRHKKLELPTPDQAPPGRPLAMPVADTHVVLGTPMKGPWPTGHEVVVFGMGCFWGAERIFWRIPGVYSTSAGYAGGFTRNATYEEACSGTTGHAEVVQVVYDPAKISYDDLLKVFWESHDPTQGMRQGNDVGTQYRSVIFTHTDAQRAAAEASRAMYQRELTAAGYGQIATEIRPADTFYFAEDYHQQYLAKVPNGYCPNHATGVTLEGPIIQMEQV